MLSLSKRVCTETSKLGVSAAYHSLPWFRRCLARAFSYQATAISVVPAKLLQTRGALSCRLQQSALQAIWQQLRPFQDLSYQSSRTFATWNQLLAGARKPKPKKDRRKALEANPFKKGVCKRVYAVSPKKPNSANRWIAKVALSNGKMVNAYIPGEGHNLQEHSLVLVRGGRVKDLVGVKYKIIRGNHDCVAVKARMNGRSKYGAKKPSKAAA